MKIAISTVINGQPLDATVKPNQVLLEFLRDDLALKGSVEGCGVGVCGSCTVLLDGRPVSSCLMLASNADGKRSQPSKGCRKAARSIRYKKCFLNTRHFNAVTARRA